jgi:hypothetical protein
MATRAASSALSAIRALFTVTLRPSLSSSISASTVGVTAWPVTPSARMRCTALSISSVRSSPSAGGLASTSPPDGFILQCARAIRAASAAVPTTAETGGPPAAV